MRELITLPSKESFLLRSSEPTDAESIYAAADSSRAELSPWMPWCHEKYCLQDALDWIETITKERENRTAFPFAVFDTSEKECLGTCGLNNIHDVYRCAHLGYWIRSSATAKGLASAVAGRVARFAFEELNIVRINIVIALENVKSQRVAEKIGAKRESVLRNGMVLHGKPEDAYLYSLIPADLQG